MNPNYPAILFDVCDFLPQHVFDLSGGANEDGRIVSIRKEELVIRAISDKFPSVLPPPRHWFDIALKYNDTLIYCNVKISKGSTDNALQKKGIVHSLTNLHEKNIPNNMNFNTMHQLLEDHAIENRMYEREYYLIYLDKNNKTVIIRSICDISRFQSNPCNFLQINWKAEKKLDTTEATNDLLFQKIAKFATLSNDVRF